MINLGILKVTLRERIREKIFVISLGIAVLVLFLGMLFAELSISEPERVMVDFSLGLLAFINGFFAIYLAATCIEQEVKNQTCLLILARPVPRKSFILSKYFAVVMLSSAITIAPFVILTFLSPIGATVMEAFIGLVAEGLILASIAIFVSQFVRSQLAIAMTFSIWALSLFLPDVVQLLKSQGQTAASDFVKTMAYGLPQFYRFQLHSFESLKAERSMYDWLYQALHTLGWSGVLVQVTMWRFSKRDLM